MQVKPEADHGSQSGHLGSRLVSRLLNNADNIKHPAVIEEGVCWSYADLLEKAIRLASSLNAKGIKPGDKVAIMLMNQKEFLVSFFALRILSAVVVPLNIQMPPEDLRFILRHSESRLVITNPLFAKHFEGTPLPLLIAGEHPEAVSEMSWEAAVSAGNADFSIEAESLETLANPDLHVLIYTSGTTGQPKGVMLSEKNLIANLDGIHPVIGLVSEDKGLLALPLFHAYGLMIGLYLLDQKGTLILVPNFSPKKILESIIQHQVTVLPLVPTMFGVMLQGMKKAGAEAFKALRICISGGASLPPQLLKDVEESLNIVVLEGYGMTEASPVLCVNNPKRGSIPGSVGKPLPNVALKLVNDEIRVKGDNVMAGYYKNPEATAEAFDETGFLKTGDLGHLDEEGNLYISGGRIKDLIIKAGENIAPLRIEQVLYQHPAIQEASVIGVNDPKLGEDILACIQLKADYIAQHGNGSNQLGDAEQKSLEAELRKFCVSNLTPMLTPSYFRFYDELPKNASGKVLKKTLREENPTAPKK